MADQANGGAASLEELERSVRRLAPGVRVVHTALEPDPLEPISGRRVVYATTAPLPAMASLAEHLEREHDCMAVAMSQQLARGMDVVFCANCGESGSTERP